MELDIRRFEAPDETRAFDKGTFDLVEIGGMTIGRARYEPYVSLHLLGASDYATAHD